jgi:hypothetical protein
MDPGNAAQRAQSDGSDRSEPEAIDFVRFCYRRRRVGWPELYDEMCAVAGRGLYRGYGADELNGLGIGFSLFEMPALASLVQRVVAEDQARRRLAIQVVPAAAETPSPAPDISTSPVDTAAVTPVSVPPASAETEATDRHPTLIAVAAGA